ncbi:MAG: hypothetical protein R3D33_07805 [Hyphomicrobiaceae bacterium]
MTGRAFLVVMDSLGIGEAPDAARFGDTGADTLGHIAEAAAAGLADQPGGRAGPLDLPVLTRLGLGRAAEAASGRHPAGLAKIDSPAAEWGHAVEVSAGKDTPSGHWEIAGVPVREPSGHFPDREPAFPEWLTDRLIAAAGLPGLLGNRHASGTDILVQFGEAHIRTGMPIAYTSADLLRCRSPHTRSGSGSSGSYRLCETARDLTRPPSSAVG